MSKDRLIFLSPSIGGFLFNFAMVAACAVAIRILLSDASGDSFLFLLCGIFAVWLLKFTWPILLWRRYMFVASSRCLVISRYILCFKIKEESIDFLDINVAVRLSRRQSLQYGSHSAWAVVLEHPNFLIREFMFKCSAIKMARKIHQFIRSQKHLPISSGGKGFGKAW